MKRLEKIDAIESRPREYWEAYGVKDLYEDVKLLLSEIHRLRAEIEKHKIDMWGEEGRVGNPIDKELYKALEDE